MYANILPENTQEILDRLKKTDYISGFYLTGGTGLAMQIGHRQSDDLDFFTENEFKPESLQKGLEKIGHLENVQLENGTLNCFLNQVELQFLHYPYKLLKKKISWHGIFLSSTLDIACTKLLTISSRGSKKDFIDLYFLLNQYSLSFLFKKLEEKFPKTSYNKPHILKSLIYFEEANKQPSPKMHKKINWDTVKEKIKKEVKNSSI